MSKKFIAEWGENSMADMTLYNVDDMAKLLDVTKVTIWRMIKRGEVPYTRKGKRYYFPRPIIEKWIKDTTIMPESKQTSSKVGI